MHSKRRYKICICSVILGELESSKLQGLQYHFPENFRCNLAHYEKENFLIPLSITFLNPKILGFLFPTKNSLTWGVKCENETSENRREFIKLASKFVREWNGHLENFSLPQVIENSRQYLLL